VIEFQPRQDLFMADAAPRIAIHRFNQLLYVVLAITDYMTRHTFCRSNQFAVDHDQAMIKSVDKGFNHHGTAMFLCFVKSQFHFFWVLEINRDAAAVIAGQWFEDDRVADALGCTHGLRGTADDALLRHRQSKIAQNGVGLLLVRGQFNGNVAGFAGRSGLDALLVPAVSKLHQAVLIQPEPRDMSFLRRVDQRCRTRPERAPLRVANERVPLFGKIPVTIGRR
jgi:hypothetical protein